MNALDFMSVILGAFNLVLLGILLFISRQPDPQKGREAAEIHELGERIAELSKHVLTFEKKVEKQINETSNQVTTKLDRNHQESSRRLEDIHDAL